MAVNQDPISLSGGLNLVSPALKVKPGQCILSNNYECDQDDGYAWVKGYVPFDGAATALENGDFYTNDGWTFGTGWTHDADTQEAVAVAATGTLSHAVSATVGKTYRVRIITRVADSGSFTVTIGGYTSPSISAAGEVEYEFVASGTPTSIVVTPTTFTGVIDSLHIMPIVPGSGVIRGVVNYSGEEFAFRDNTGATAGDMYRATTSGWTIVDLGYYIKFTAGTAAFTIGGTLTGGVSTATAVIRDYYVVSGSFATNDAAGYIAIDTPVGGPFGAAETITDATGSATTNGAEVQNTLTAGGKYEFVIENVFGSEDQVGCFWVNGVGDAYQFTKNDALLPMEHTVSANPTHIGEYKKHIFLGFDEGAAAHSELGKPLGWSAVLSAGLFGVGDKVSGFKELSKAFLILCESKTYILYGISKNSTTEPFDLDDFEDQVGGTSCSIQTVSSTFFINHSGLVDFKSVQDYGNFSDAAISKLVRPYLTGRVDKVACSTVNQNKTQYRVFFNDKTAMYASFAGRKLIGMMPVTLADQPNVMWNSKNALKVEQTLMGSDDGKVFLMETGNLFSGRKIESFLKLAYHHFGRPAQKKRVRKADIYVFSDIGAKLTVSVDYNFGSIYRSSMGGVDVEQLAGVGSLWDIVNWDEFIWDASGDPRLEVPIDGSGIVVSMNFYNAGMIQGDHRIDTLVYHYSWRGRNR